MNPSEMSGLELVQAMARPDRRTLWRRHRPCGRYSGVAPGEICVDDIDESVASEARLVSAVHHFHR